MFKITKLEVGNGVYYFKLDDILKSRNISINKVIRDTNTDFKVLKRLSTGEIERIDITVLARLCDYLDCDINDIFEYVSYRKNNAT